MTSTPVPRTAIVQPSPMSAPSCAAASTPTARPLTTATPACARSVARRSATASPYGVGRRAPTIATFGQQGGGQRPRTLSSGSSFDKAVPQRLHDVVLADRSPRVEIRDSACNTPGSVEAAGTQTTLAGPPAQC